VEVYNVGLQFLEITSPMKSVFYESVIYHYPARDQTVAVIGVSAYVWDCEAKFYDFLEALNANPTICGDLSIYS